jgi:glycosyltransferase involved in cell wall biosynthesis
MTAQLSLTMIVCDEELTLGRVLGQAATFCDEMVIVDTGSQDHTLEVAREAGAASSISRGSTISPLP